MGTHTRLSAGMELGTGAGSGEGQLSGHPGWELAVHISPVMGGSKRPQLQCSLDSNHKINPNKPGVEGSHPGPDKLGSQKSEHGALGTQTLGFTQQTNGMCPNQAVGPVLSGDVEASVPSARPPWADSLHRLDFLPNTSTVGSGLHILCPWLCPDLDNFRYGFPRPVLPGGEGGGRKGSVPGKPSAGGRPG